MDKLYEVNGCMFVWDIRKSRTNIAKHGVSFEQAVEAFFDPFVRLIDNTDHSSPECRDALLGMDLDTTVCGSCRGRGSAIPHYICAPGNRS